MNDIVRITLLILCALAYLWMFIEEFFIPHDKNAEDII